MYSIHYRLSITYCVSWIDLIQLNECQGFLHGFQWDSTAIDAKGDGAVLVAHHPFDQRVLDTCLT